jgi:molybdopterin converting factor small subunit
MVVTAVLFGGLRSDAGEDALPVDLPDGETNVQSLLDRLGQQVPSMGPRLAGAVCAVADEIVSYDHILRDGDTVDVLPPVSGG